MSDNMNYNTRADTTPVQYRDKPTFRKEYVDKLRAENERLKKRAESAEKALWDIVFFVPGVGEKDYSDKLIRIAETAVGMNRKILNKVTK